jgi:Zn-dependent protease/CBS domain-containing protein
MFGKKLHLFSLFGFKVGLDFTWILLAVLVTWSLATGLFPHYFEGFAASTYWWMGIAGALGLFVSIVFHEISHSLVARRFGLPMKGITLFIFGGVAEMDEEPPSPKAEFFMAIAGPIASVALAGLLYSAGLFGGAVAWPDPVVGVLRYLALLNLILAGFNLVPAFPLDGGRVLRSALWEMKGNLRWATRIASSFGSAFGVFLIVLGVLSFMGGGFVGGIWYFLIGLFIRAASHMSYQHVVMRKALHGEQVKRFMKEGPVTVPSSVSVDELVNNYFYKYHYKLFPVTNGDGLSGCVTTRQVKQLAKDQWSERTIHDIQEPCSDENTIAPHADAMSALSRMKRTDKSRLLVVEGDRLVGILTLKDLLRFLALKIDLEEE